MYQVIATRKEDEGKSVKPFWVAKTYKTFNAAQKFKIAQNRINKIYTFDIEDIG
jgi:hypothetical protein